MWIKVLKYVYIAAKATGLDKKVQQWVLGKLAKAQTKAIIAVGKKLESIDDAVSVVAPIEDVDDDWDEEGQDED